MLAGFVLHSCIFIRMDDSIDLGYNYRLIQDYPKVIIYNMDSTSKIVGGVNILPPIVFSYDFNDKYIIAKSQEVSEMTGARRGH